MSGIYLGSVDTLLTSSGLDKYLENYPSVVLFYNAMEGVFLKYYHMIPSAQSIPFLEGKNIYLMTILSCLLYNIMYNVLTRVEYSCNIFKKLGNVGYPVFASIISSMWLFKSYLIMQTIITDADSYIPARPQAACIMGILVVLISALIFALTVVYSGFKRLLGGEVFDHSLALPPTGGLNEYIDTPNYTASAFFILGYSLLNKSTKGIYLSLIVCLIYCVSSRTEENLSAKICGDMSKNKEQLQEAAEQTPKKNKKKNKGKTA